MAADGADCGQLLSVAPPFIYTKLRKTAQRLTSLSNCTKTDLSIHYQKMYHHQDRVVFIQAKQTNNSLFQLVCLILQLLFKITAQGFSCIENYLVAPKKFQKLQANSRTQSNFHLLEMFRFYNLHQVKKKHLSQIKLRNFKIHFKRTSVLTAQDSHTQNTVLLKIKLLTY